MCNSVGIGGEVGANNHQIRRDVCGDSKTIKEYYKGEVSVIYSSLSMRLNMHIL